MKFTVTDDNYLSVRFSEIEEFLGREHRGSGEDDQAIIAQLLKDGAPLWIAENEGFLEADATDAWWCIKGPGFNT